MKRLRNGMLVRTRDKKMYMFVGDTPVGNYLIGVGGVHSFDIYNDVWCEKFGDSRLDIMEVFTHYRPDTMSVKNWIPSENVIWTRGLTNVGFVKKEVEYDGDEFNQLLKAVNDFYGRVKK